MDNKTLIGLIIVTCLLIAAFLFGRNTVKPIIVPADTVTVHNYTEVETSFLIDTTEAYLRIVKNNAKLKSINLKLQKYSDSLKLWVDNSEQIVASLDTLLNKDTLSIQYFFPPLNSFLINYRARPIINTKDTVRITKTETIKQKGLWIMFSPSYQKGFGSGISAGYSHYGIGIVFSNWIEPIYMLHYKLDF